MHADEKLSAFIELERQVLTVKDDMIICIRLVAEIAVTLFDAAFLAVSAQATTVTFCRKKVFRPRSQCPSATELIDTRLRFGFVACRD